MSSVATVTSRNDMPPRPSIALTTSATSDSGAEAPKAFDRGESGRIFAPLQILGGGQAGLRLYGYLEPEIHVFQ